MREMLELSNEDFKAIMKQCCYKQTLLYKHLKQPKNRKLQQRNRKSQQRNVKMNQMENLEVENRVIKRQSLVDELRIRTEGTEERIGELEHRTIETT